MKYQLLFLLCNFVTFLNCFPFDQETEFKQISWPKISIDVNTTFGHNMLQYFAMDPTYTNLNFGSFGSPPKDVIKAQRYWQDFMDIYIVTNLSKESTDKWFRYILQPIYNQVIARLAAYLGADASDVVLLENASTGVNSVVRSLKFNPGEKMLFLNIAYDMVQNTIKYEANRDEEQVVQVYIPFPTSNEQILQLVEQAITNNTNCEQTPCNSSIRFASFSHISSVPSLLLPVNDLVRLCKKYGILVMIDGAHAMGHIPVNVTDIGADFYISNGHKWLFSPKGSAVLWVRKELQSLIHPTVISNGFANGFQAQFSWTGTRDYSAMLAMWTALDWRSNLGEENIMNYIHELAVWTGHTLAGMWNTSVLVEDDMIGAMTNVIMPTNDMNKASIVQLTLLSEYNTYLVVAPFEGRIITRISTQIFNEKSDILTLGQRVLDILKAL